MLQLRNAQRMALRSARLASGNLPCVHHNSGQRKEPNKPIQGVDSKREAITGQVGGYDGQIRNASRSTSVSWVATTAPPSSMVENRVGWYSNFMNKCTAPSWDTWKYLEILLNWTVSVVNLNRTFQLKFTSSFSNLTKNNLLLNHEIPFWARCKRYILRCRWAQKIWQKHWILTEADLRNVLAFWLLLTRRI